MHRWRKLGPKVLGAALLICLCSFPASAVSLYPLMLVFTEEEPIAILELQNDEAQAHSYELHALSWQQTGGEDVYAKSDTLVITPSRFQLDGYEKKLIRIGIVDRSAFDGSEKAFRILLRDVTPKQERARTGPTLRLQMLLPAFIPARQPSSMLHAEPFQNRQGELCIQTRNSGNSTVKLLWAARSEEASFPDRQLSLNRYLHAGQGAKLCTSADYTQFAGKPLKLGMALVTQNGFESHIVELDGTPTRLAVQE